MLTVDVGSTNSINNTTSDNWGIGKDLALQLVSDIGGEGNIVVFNGFYGVTPCAIRYDQLVNVVKYFPKVKIIRAGAAGRYPEHGPGCFHPVSPRSSTNIPRRGLSRRYGPPGIFRSLARPSSRGRRAYGSQTYGVDGSLEVLQLIADPNSPAGADAAQQPAEIGRTAIRNVAKLLAGQTLPRETCVPALLANKTNVAEVTKKLGIG